MCVDDVLMAVKVILRNTAADSQLCGVACCCSLTSLRTRSSWRPVLAAPATAVLRLLLCWPSGPCWTLLVLLLPWAPGTQQQSQARWHLQVGGANSKTHINHCKTQRRGRALPNALLCQCCC
jgi:hypothetical protein